jgi:hypothetical protein
MRSTLPLLLALTLPALAAAQGLEVKASPTSVVLGRDEAVRVELSRPDGAPLRLAAAASTGSLAAEGSEGGRVARFTYTPPEARHPHWATLLFWELAEGAQPSAPTVLRLPLLGRTTLDISTEPEAEVVVQVQRARFGPARANARGQARIAVEVPPGVRSARVLATVGGEQTEREVALDVPDDGALAVLMSPEAVPAGGSAWLAVAADPGLGPEALLVTAEGGSVQSLQTRPPVYRITPDAGVREVKLRVRRREGAEELTRTLAVRSAARPAAAPAPPPPPEPRLSLHLLGGGFLARGANRGPAAALGAGYTLPLLQGRLAAEAELGLRRVVLEGALQGGVDRVRSRVIGAPLLLSLRLGLLERGALSLGARLGAGLTVFRHRLQSPAHADFSEGGVDPAGFLALQGGYRLGPLTLLAEARGSVQPATTPRLDARLGGLGLLLGMRYVP